MRHEIVNVPVDPTLIPETAHKFAQQALREHQRAEKDVIKAVEHISSQRQAFKALAAIARAEENRRPKAIDGKGAARCANGGGKGAARCANGGERARTGPVWRTSGPLVNEALRLVSSVDATLGKLVSRGFPLQTEADDVHAALELLRTISRRRHSNGDRR